MGFDWCVSISLAYCIPIKLDEKVSLWYMLKRLAEYEPGYAKRAHDAMVTGDPLGKVLLKRAAQSVIVRNDSVEYCEDEIDKEAKNPRLACGSDSAPQKVKSAPISVGICRHGAP